MAVSIIEKALGVGTRTLTNRVTSSVASTAAQIAYGDPNRIQLCIINTGSYDMYVGCDRQVSSATAWLVPHGGGALIFLWEEDYEMCFSEFFAVAPTGTTTILVIELVVTGKPPTIGVTRT
jgi:hypothetical protein